MYYCNEFLSMSVLSLYEGELVGKVDKLFFDKRLKKLVEIEIIGENDTKYTLPTKNIYHVGKHAITIKNNQAVSLKVEDTSLISSPIGSKAYSINGEFLGIIKEISLDEKFFAEKFSLDNNSTISVNIIASCGKNTIIFNDNSEKININKFKGKPSPKIFKVTEVQNVEIMPTQKSPDSVESKNVVPVDAPKPIQNTEFLIGRISTKAIYNFNNELLIKANGVVTKKNLKEIIRFGKVRELMLYSK